MEIKIVQDVLEENDELAKKVRSILREKKRSMFNIMSSPGSGKTTLLEKLIPILKEKGQRVAVIEGDITTTNDAMRLQPLNIPIAQINTEPWGGDCHLGSNVILRSMEMFDDQEIDIYIIENVGNLVCPAEFDTGADHNMVVLSVAEGEDKPLKYPLMFRVCDLGIVNKVDIAEVLEANIGLIEENMKKINPEIDVLKAAPRKGDGLQEISDWIIARHNALL